MRRLRGFTVIEVMIVVAIIAILASIAVPAYSDYIKRSHITEAVSGLSEMRVKMEQYFQDHRSYAGACQPSTIAPVPERDHFTFTCDPTPSATAYKVVATGKTGVMDGFVYTINQDNLRTSTGGSGWSSNATCWLVKRDGTC